MTLFRGYDAIELVRELSRPWERSPEMDKSYSVALNLDELSSYLKYVVEEMLSIPTEKGYGVQRIQVRSSRVQAGELAAENLHWHCDSAPRTDYDGLEWVPVDERHHFPNARTMNSTAYLFVDSPGSLTDVLDEEVELDADTWNQIAVEAAARRFELKRPFKTRKIPNNTIVKLPHDVLHKAPVATEDEDRIVVRVVHAFGKHHDIRKRIDGGASLPVRRY